MALTDVFGKAVLAVTADTKGLATELKGAESKSTRTLTRFAKRVGSINVFKPLLLGAVATSAAFVKLGFDAIKMGDEVAKTSKVLGISTKALSELRFVAEQSGVNVATLDASMAALTRRIDKAASGNEEFAKAFRRLNVAVVDTGGNLRSTEVVFNDIANAIRLLGPGGESARLLFDTMSDGGQRLLPIMLEGADGIAKMREQAELLGLSVSTEFAEASEDASEKLGLLRGVAKGLALTIGKEVLPVISSVAGAMFQWALENASIIRQNIVQTMKLLGDVLKTVFEVAKLLGPTFAFFGRRLVEVAQLGIVSWEGVKTAIALALAIASDRVASFVELASQAWFQIKRGASIAFEGIKAAVNATLAGILPDSLAQDFNDKLLGNLQTIRELKNEEFSAGAFATGLRDTANVLRDDFNVQLKTSIDRISELADVGSKATTTFGEMGDAAGDAGAKFRDVSELALGLANRATDMALAAKALAEQTAQAALQVFKSAQSEFASFTDVLLSNSAQAQKARVEDTAQQLATVFDNARQLGIISAEDAAFAIERIESASAERRKAIEKSVNAAKIRGAVAVASGIAGLLGQSAALQDTTNREGFEKAKKLQIAEATIGAITGAINAYTSAAAIPFIGYIIAPIVAAIALASGFLNVRKIRQTTFSGAAAGGLDKVPRDGTFMVHKGETIIPANPAESIRFFAEKQLPALVSSLNAASTRSPGITSTSPVGQGLASASRSTVGSTAGTSTVDTLGAGFDQGSLARPTLQPPQQQLDISALAAAIGSLPIDLTLGFEQGSGPELEQVILQGLNASVRDRDGRLASSVTKTSGDGGA